MTLADPASPPAPPVSCWRLGLTWYAVSSAIVIVGVVGAFGQMPEHDPWYDFFARWDGTHYARICREGYRFDPAGQSSAAFMPIYPLLALPFMALGLEAPAALLVVSQLALAGCFVALAVYARERWPDAPPEQVRAAVLALAFLPPTFFLHMAYSESLFLLCLLLVLLLVQRQGPLWAIALLAGTSTGVRIVGVALLPVLLLHAWRRSSGPGQFLLRAAWLVPLACYGLLGFMGYTALAFGEPLAFLKAHQQWSMAHHGGGSKLTALLTLQPFWQNFVPGSPCYWQDRDPLGNPWTSLVLGNPIWFGAAGLLLAWGIRRHLNAYEALLAAGLWVIPYVTRSHEMCMGSAARFIVPIVPVYLLLGLLCGRLSTWAGFAVLAPAALLLALYSTKFAQWGPWFF
jgi:hypothetical protein